MERLLADAEKFSGVKYDISNLSDVYNAIHVIQQEMGITGTTAEEAAGTISGSFGSVKAAWENLVTGFSDKNANLPALINDVVLTAETSFNNLLPVIKNAIEGLATFVEDIAPIIADKLPGLVADILPPLLSTANKVVNSLVESLPSMLQSVVGVVPGIITDISETLIKLLPRIGDLGLDLIISLADGITESLPHLIPVAIDAIDEYYNTFTKPENLTKIFDSGFDLLITLADGIADNLPKLVETATKVIDNVCQYILDPENIAKILDAALRIVAALGVGIIAAAPKAIEGIAKVIDNIIEKWTSADWAGLGEDVDVKIAEAISANAGNITDAWNSMLETLDSMLGTSLADMTKQVEDWSFDVGKKIYAALHPDDNAEIRSIEISGNIQNAIDEALKEGYEPQQALRQGMSVLSREDYDIYDKYLKGEFTLEKVQARADELVSIAENAIAAEEDLAKRATYIPTEALRQQAGKAADIIKTLPDSIDRAFLPVETSIETASDKAGNTMQGAAEEATETLKQTADFAAKGIGEYTNLGVKQILGHTLTEEEAAADKMAKAVFNYQSAEIQHAATMGATLDEQLASWELIRQQFVEGSEQALKADEKIYGLKENIRKRDEKAAEEATAAEQKAIDEADKAFKAKVQHISDMAEAEGWTNQRLLDEWNTMLADYEYGTDEWITIAKKAASAQKAVVNDEIANIQLLAKNENWDNQRQLQEYETLRDKYAVGSAEWTALEAKAADSRQKVREEELSNAKAAQAEYEKIISNAQTNVENAKKSIESLWAKYDSELEKQTSNIMNSFSLFEKVPERVVYSGLDLKKNLQDQIETTKLFYKEIAELRKRGVSEELADSIEGMGVDALDQLDALLALEDKDLAEYSDLYDKKSKLAGDIAENQLAGLKSETENQVDELTSDLDSMIKESGENLGYTFTESFAEGLIDGTATIKEVFEQNITNSLKTVALSSFANIKSMLDFAGINPFSAKSDVLSANNAITGTSSLSAVSSTENITSATKTTAKTSLADKVTVNVNVNGVQYQTFGDLARAIAEEIQLQIERREAGYAGA